MKKILHPKNNIIILGIFIILFSLIYLIFFNKFGTPLSYLLYLLMTYSLIIISIKVYEIIKSKIDLFIDNNKYLNQYKNDYELKYKISLIISLIFNIIYALFKLILGIIYNSIWFITMFLYYILLVTVRTSIIKQVLNKQNTLKEQYIKYRKIAITLLFINVILTMIILVIVNQKIIKIYPNFLALTVALYTFCSIFFSIYSLIKYHKYKQPLISSSKIISVINSLVSLISLEIILIPTFETSKTNFFEIMVTLTGGGIAIIIFIIAIYMIIKATEYLNN